MDDKSPVKQERLIMIIENVYNVLIAKLDVPKFM